MGLGAVPSKIYGKSSVTQIATSQSCSYAARVAELDQREARLIRNIDNFEKSMNEWRSYMQSLQRAFAMIPGAPPPPMPPMSPIDKSMSSRDDEVVNSRLRGGGGDASDNL